MKMIWFIFRRQITQTRLGSRVWRRALIIPVDQVVLRRDPAIGGEDFLSIRGQSWSPFPQLSSSPGMNPWWHHIDSPVPRSLGVIDAGRLLLDLRCWSHNDQCQTAPSWLVWSAIFFFFSSCDCPHMTPECETPALTFPWKREATCDVGLLKMCKTINWKNTKGAI